MMLNKPVISLQTELSALDENIVKENAILSIDDKDKFESVFKQILTDQEFKEEKSKEWIIYGADKEGGYYNATMSDGVGSGVI